MTYRLARALDVLRTQVNARWPARSKASDGWIGDAAHATRSSDHNPWVKAGSVGIVTALDITHDPAHGLDARKLAETLIASRDPRIKYIISNTQICSSYPTNGKPAWVWRPYSGANAHRHHVHISVNPEVVHYDSTKPWNLDGAPVAAAPAKPAVAAAVTTLPTLSRGSKGYHVGYLQRMLGITDDQIFGPMTEKAVQQFQTRAKLPANGVADPVTWAALVA